MSTYPLPGETIARSLRNVTFGMARPLDEPAPPELAALFIAWRAAEDEEDQAYMAHDVARYSRSHFCVWLETQSRVKEAYGRLADALKKHRHRCYVINNQRFWWHIDVEGCRREYVKHQDICP